MKKNTVGFTLIEMMIVVAIVAILIAIAYPSYVDYVRKARRSDGMDALLNLQVLQERYRASNTTYGTLAQIGGDAASTEGHYGLVVGNVTATTYTLTANANGDQNNDQEDGTDCTPLTITVTAANPRGVKGPDQVCW